MMFYESAKSYHQRSVPMNGRYYASIFIHYRPVGWNMTRHDVRAAIPPWWSDGLPGYKNGPPATPEAFALHVKFYNGYSDEVVLHWIVPGEKDAEGKEVMKPLVTVPAGATSLQNTYEGHTFIAVASNGEHWERIDIQNHHDGNQISVGSSWPRHEEM
eukprot:scaffold546779_cov37-Prasinocladus_malaysianus.AAC.2